VNELFVMVVRATLVARIIFTWQATRLSPVMNKFRQANRQRLVVATLMLIGFAPLGLAASLPGHGAGGSNSPDRGVSAVVHDGVSLDEAVSRAERQYRARVVRTDVQDEDGRKVYVLKMLSEDGRVFTVRIDAATGRMR
jgi:hypothetical protein